jgi:hypothetical protein
MKRREETMAVLPADEDYARGLLTIFTAMRVRPGQSLKAAQVNVEFLDRNLGRPADYQAALAFSVSQGWLRLELGMIRLTTDGFSET